MGTFSIRVVFTLIINSGMSVWRWIFKPISMNAVKDRDFPVCYLFTCCLEFVWMYVHQRAFFEQLQLCFHVVYPFWLFVMMLPFPYFAQKSFCLSRIRLLLWLRLFSSLLVVEYFSLFWTDLLWLNYLASSQYLFSLPSFTSIFDWFPESFFFEF